MLVHESFVDLKTPAGTMRTYVFEPACKGSFGGIVCFTEIYQVTGPVERLCRLLASEGFVVCAPESYHEFEPPGSPFKYNPEDTDKGNRYKVEKPIGQYDDDAQAVVDFLGTHPGCNGRIGSIGMCLGGHLAFRCAMVEAVSCGVSLFGTDIHSGTLGKGGDDTLARIPDLKNTELLMVFGKQDRHVPLEGRRKIRAAMDDAELDFSWCEFNTRHAFIRDELSKGRYDPAITRIVQSLAIELFHRRLTLGCSSTAEMQPQTTAPGPKC